MGGDEPTYAVEQIELDLMREIYGNNVAAQAYGTGPTVVVLYSNYLCPFCRELWDSLETIIHDDSTSATVYVRHLVPPILGNPAYLAALGAECAGDQGRFDAFHRVALESQDRLSTVSFEQLARQADIPDVPRFNTCVDDEVHKFRITVALEEAEYLSLAGTPAMVIGQRLVIGTPALKELQKILSSRGKAAWLD
ncbi:MAG: thioredoxin domain-containing protein [Gemmatimonadetes bacterium]|nr:thioredoxin domain-containing protein [Candidatus Palauibacter rhopaloidicola]